MPDPYKAGMFKNSPYAKKTAVKGKLVVVLEGELEGRDLSLINPISRALCKNEIHELIFTDEKNVGPGKKVNSIGYLGFTEILEGGVIVVGDNIKVDGEIVGRIAGFDDTHMPNHWNIIINSDVRTSGNSRGYMLGQEIIIEK